VRQPVVVTPARPEDAGAWSVMRQKLWPSAPGEHAGEIETFFQEGPREGEATFVAWSPGSVPVGFAEARIRAYAEGCVTDRVAYLEGIFVEEDRRGLGIATALLRAVEAWGREQGCSEMASDAALDNEASLAFHRRTGFSEVERIVCFRRDL
jgi:aminoglycoside 6'-N-acetyltransferase I